MICILLLTNETSTFSLKFIIIKECIKPFHKNLYFTHYYLAIIVMILKIQMELQMDYGTQIDPHKQVKTYS
jgi:hypothetical protein